MKRKLLLGSIATIVFFMFCEGGLWLYCLLFNHDFRKQPLPGHPEYEVLCSWGELAKLCPDRGPSYERVRPEVFTPKGSRKRIIFIGESFVYGLGIQAHEAFPKRVGELLEIEALNFGRCGTYASRLIPIMKAAVTLEPDLIVLSTGNNEHTMTSFFQGSWGRKPLQSYRRLKTLGAFQLYGVLSTLFGRQDVRIVETFDEVPQYLDADLDKAVFAARRRPPNLKAFPNGLASSKVRAVLEEEQDLKEMIFQDQLRVLVDLSQEASVPIMLTTLPQEAFIPPTLSGTQLEDSTEIIKYLQSHNFQKGLELDDQVAMFHFEEALMHERKGDLKAAINAFERSVSLNLVPDSTPEINAIIQSVAHEKGVPLLDLRARAWAYAQKPRAMFLDSVHLNTDGAQITAEWIAEGIRQHFPSLVP